LSTFKDQKNIGEEELDALKVAYLKETAMKLRDVLDKRHSVILHREVNIVLKGQNPRITRVNVLFYSTYVEYFNDSVLN
jgi:hypothetical protein